MKIKKLGMIALTGACLLTSASCTKNNGNGTTNTTPTDVTTTTGGENTTTTTPVETNTKYTRKGDFVIDEVTVTSDYESIDENIAAKDAGFQEVGMQSPSSNKKIIKFIGTYNDIKVEVNISFKTGYFSGRLNDYTSGFRMDTNSIAGSNGNRDLTYFDYGAEQGQTLYDLEASATYTVDGKEESMTFDTIEFNDYTDKNTWNSYGGYQYVHDNLMPKFYASYESKFYSEDSKWYMIKEADYQARTSFEIKLTKDDYVFEFDCLYNSTGKLTLDQQGPFGYYMGFASTNETVQDCKISASFTYKNDDYDIELTKENIMVTAQKSNIYGWINSDRYPGAVANEVMGKNSLPAHYAELHRVFTVSTKTLD